MSFRVRTYGQGIEIIDGDTVFAPDADVGSGNAGSDLILVAGAGDGAGDGGGVIITPGLAPGAGANGFVSITTTANVDDPVLRLDRSGSASQPSSSDLFVGDTAPAFTALAGSLFLLNDGATTGSLYVQTDASSAGSGSTWVDLTSAGASDLATVLAAGNTTGGSDIVVSIGDEVTGVDSASVSGGDVTLRGGDHTGAAAVSNGGSVTIRGGDTNSGTNGVQGGDVTIQGGDLVGTGAGGSVTLRTTSTSGTNGAILFETTGQNTAGPDYTRGDIVIDTVPSEAGTGWCHRTLVFEGVGVSFNTVLTFDDPVNNGDNLKVRLWCTMVDLADADSQATQLQERVFYKDSGGNATLLGTLQNLTAVSGGGAGGSSADVVVDGSGNIVVRANIDAGLANVRFVYEIDYQYNNT